MSTAPTTAADDYADDPSKHYVAIICEICGITSHPSYGVSTTCYHSSSGAHSFKLETVFKEEAKNLEVTDASVFCFLLPDSERSLESGVLNFQTTGPQNQELAIPDYPLADDVEDHQIAPRSHSSHSAPVRCFVESSMTKLLIEDIRSLIENLKVNEFGYENEENQGTPLYLYPETSAKKSCFEDTFTSKVSEISNLSIPNAPQFLVLDQNCQPVKQEEIHVPLLVEGLAVQVAWKIPHDNIGPSWFDGTILSISEKSLRIQFRMKENSTLNAQIWTHMKLFVCTDHTCLHPIPGMFRLRPTPLLEDPEFIYPALVAACIPHAPCRMFDALLFSEATAFDAAASCGRKDLVPPFKLQFLHDSSEISLQSSECVRYLLQNSVDSSAIQRYMTFSSTYFSEMPTLENVEDQITPHPLQDPIHAPPDPEAVGLGPEFYGQSPAAVGWATPSPEADWYPSQTSSPEDAYATGCTFFVLTSRGVVLASYSWSVEANEIRLTGPMMKIYWLDGKLKRIEFFPLGGSMVVAHCEVILTSTDEQQVVGAASRVQLQCATCNTFKNADQYPIEGKLRKVRCRTCKTDGIVAAPSTSSVT